MQILLAFLLLLVPAPAHLPAQPAPAAWRLEADGQTTTVAEAAHRGYPALPVSSLAALGARLSYGRGEVAASFGGREVRFRVDSPGVLVDGRPRMLAHPVYTQDGIVFVPAEFFATLLAEAAPGAVTVDAAARVVRADPSRLAAAPVPAITSAPAPVPAAPPAAAPAPTSQPQRRLVVIDAGHGGTDPGAVGPRGTREKDITLQLARRVVALLADDPTLEVRMTRNRDTLIALRDRGRFANQWRREGQPALFMSIHCNAHNSRAEMGFETFFLAEARTADARRVQQMEDAAERFEQRPAGGSPLDFILTDLRQNQYLRESSDWAQMIQDRLREIHPGPNRGVKQAGFAVLVGAFMPAVLVEVGFISNYAEEEMLADPRQQETLARQLAAGVRDFFRDQDRRAAAAGSN
ncbi:MAG TPA: N-acetylmuramoyl-L-alanine amidase [Longimicrobium sp.]|nr:N-acetylmuramoyl-L-alanine amidase [Longimicrobium sp.]